MKNLKILIYLILLMVLNKVNAQVNLSEQGTANCYIVTQEGAYCFTATRGNETEPLDGVKKVDWIWSDRKGQIDEVSYKDGKVTFKASNKRGNAVIAAFDSEDKILWSWHIWMTDDPRVNLHKVQDYYIMDRNLGAISNKKNSLDSYGLYYQWGRKDPFIGGNATGERLFELNYTPLENVAFTNATKGYTLNPKFRKLFFNTIGNNDPSIPMGGSVKYAVQNPTTFITYVNRINSSAEGDWLNSTQIDGLWGFMAPNYNTSSVKTIHDPCPVGYRTAHAGYAVFWTQDPVLHGASPRRISQDPNVEFLGGTRSFVYTYEGKPFFYPAAGYRNKDGKLTGLGNEILLSTAIISDPVGTPKSWGTRTMRIMPLTKDGVFYDYWTNPTERIYRAQANPCRCIKE